MTLILAFGYLVLFVSVAFAIDYFYQKFGFEIADWFSSRK